MTTLVLEVGLGLLMLGVFAVGLVTRGDERRIVGLLSAVGVLALAVGSFFLEASPAPARGAFVLDGLALFGKQLFLVATFIGILGSLSLPDPAFRRRAPEYYLLLLASLLGMLVLASARELILLFVAFELMSIPLYVLSGFLKREDVAGGAALKFFLVGTVSSAILPSGLSFW